jgi:transketolase C-terminal domain/subunit
MRIYLYYVSNIHFFKIIANFCFLYFCHIGGIGEAVLSAVAEERDICVKKLAVSDIPRSGPSNVLLDLFGISSKNIVAAVKKFVN